MLPRKPQPPARKSIHFLPLRFRPVVWVRKTLVAVSSSATSLLKPGGTLAIIDWFKKENLEPAEHKKFIQPIEKGMLVGLHTMEEDKAMVHANRLQIADSEILNKQCARTWDICLDLIKKKAFWTLPPGLALSLSSISGPSAP
jgi:hypothetical protein